MNTRTRQLIQGRIETTVKVSPPFFVRCSVPTFQIVSGSRSIAARERRRIYLERGGRFADLRAEGYR